MIDIQRCLALSGDRHIIYIDDAVLEFMWSFCECK